MFDAQMQTAMQIYSIMHVLSLVLSEIMFFHVMYIHYSENCGEISECGE